MGGTKVKRLFLVAVLLLPGCASMKAMARQARDTSVKVVPVAVVVVVTGPLGLGVQAACTLATVIITDLFTENASLSSGETIGEGARDAELNRLKSMLLVANGEKTLTQLAVGEMAGGKDWAVKWLKRAAWAIGLMVVFWFLARKRYIKRTITGDGAGSRPWMLVHAVFGWDWTRRLAFGYEPLKITKKKLIGTKAVR